MRPHSSSKLAPLSLLVLGSTFALACAAPASDHRASPVTETVVIEHTTSGMRHATPVTGRLVTTPDTAVAATIAFFARHHELGLARPESSLAPKNVERDELGMTHVKLQQLAHGIPVRGAEIAAHYAADGSLASIDAKIAGDLDDADPTPALSSEQAFVAAQQHVAGTDPSLLPSDLRAEKAPALTFLSSSLSSSLSSGRPRLVWATRLAADAPTIVRAWTFVDAKTGAVESYDDLRRTAITAKGYSGLTQTLQIEPGNNGYVLKDITRTPNGLHTVDVKNGTDLAKNVYVTSSNGTTWDPVGVDAHAHTAMAFDYYKTAHGRASYDNLNGSIATFIHYDKNLDNAFNQGNGTIVYGDGAPGVSRPNAVALDIVAHELTHGITETSSGLIYQQQSGALDEAIADILGAAIEHHYRPDATKNWTHSEDAYLDGKPVRNLKSPREARPIGLDGLEYPRHMKEYAVLPLTLDQGGVHVNSVLIGHTAYLMAMGGTNEVSKVTVARGIGWENLAKVWYRANTRYFLTTTNFVEAAKGTLTAAKDLALSAEDQDTVECAWIATGVLEGTCKAKVEQPKPAESQPKPQSKDDKDEDDGDDTTPAKKSSSKKPTTTVVSEGCSVARGESGTTSSLLTTLVIVALALATRRARRSGRV